MTASEPTPCILVVDADPGVATGLTRELQYGFGREYKFLATLSARSGLDILERLGAASQPVALVMVGLQLPDLAGPEFLSRARNLHPLAKRIALGGLGELVSSAALHRAMTLGQADSWLMTPWAPHDQCLRARVAELLDEWLDDSGRQQFVLAHVVGERRDPRSMELRDLAERSGARYCSRLRSRPRVVSCCAGPAAEWIGSRWWSCSTVES